VPPSLAPYPNRTLVDYLADAAATRPDLPAILFKGSTLSWRALDRLSDQRARLRSKRSGSGAAIAIALLLPNCPQFVIAQFGAWKVGAIVAPLNPTYTERELEGPLRDHGIETIVTLTRFYARVKAVQPRTPLRRVIATNIKEYFPPCCASVHDRPRETGRRSHRAGARRPDLARLLRAHTGRGPRARPRSTGRSGRSC
jgi:long-chain acyl-CoA synthetase